MKKIFFALLVALAPTLCFAADVTPKKVASVPVVKEDTKYVLPVQKIEGAEAPIELGDVVFLNLSKIEKAPDNLVSYSVDWVVFDKGVEKKFFKTDNGNGIFFGSGITKRKLQVLASVSYLYVVKDGDKLVEAVVKSKLLVVTVDIGGAGPGPNPDPNPEPEPDPKFPDGVYNLAAKSYSLKDKVKVDQRRGGEWLSKSFASQAAKIAAGPELLNANDIKKVLVDTAESNRKALTDNFVEVAAWNAYITALEDEVYNLYSSGKLKTKNDFSTAWREISLGLEKVK